MKTSTFKESVKAAFNIDSVKFKVAVIICILFYLPIIFKVALLRFNTTDPTPPIKAINTEVLKKLGPFTVSVKVGMFIKNFPVFDIIKNTFLVDSLIWFEFNSDEIMLETIEKFSIDNGKINFKSPPDIKVNGQRIFAKYNVLFELKTDLTFNKFPFEDHRLPILVSNDFVTPEEMYFLVDASSFQTLPGLNPAGWKIQDLSIDSGFIPLQLDKQDVLKATENPKALFMINFVKASSRKVLIIFIPIFSAVFLALLSCVMNIANVVGKFSLAVSALTAILGYRFVIEQMMPQVGYFTTTDALYLFLLVFCFIMFLFQLLITREFAVASELAKQADLQQKPSEPTFKEKLERINSIIFIIMSFLLVLTTTYIILR